MASEEEAASPVLALELALTSAPAAAQMERRRRAAIKAFREGMADEVVIDNAGMCLSPTDYHFWLTSRMSSCFLSTMYEARIWLTGCVAWRAVVGMCLQT